ncbi:AEC family transporter [Dyella sp. C11]|uniref:AEC family transporter n=1 Tax=Dyella sp. C11 TaxID=2126991 RepID=UPI000D646E2F|nr:AEC family transporter [Dyella sp. C11]
MNVLLNIVLPVFALIGAGWFARRRRWLGETAAAELNRFVVYVAMPALLFRIMATASWHDLRQPGFIAAFTIGCGVVFVIALIRGRLRGQSLSHSNLDGLNASYANVGFIGFPLCLAAFGPASLTSVTITAIVTVCVLFGASVALMEIDQSQEGGWRILRKVLFSVAKNPMVLAPVLGVLYAALMPTIPVGADHFLKYLADAASPCALVSLGAFIGERREAAPWSRVTSLVALKLAAQPAATWLLAHEVFQISMQATGVAVVIAALPTGTGPYMLANMYGKDAQVVASSILISTLLSIVTISLLIALFHTG